jgi:hypothetical protein
VRRLQGVWTPFTWEHDGRAQHGVVLTPNEGPWRRLLVQLDRVGQNLSAEPVTPLEAADANVAACWRYGTFFHVLTFGESYPLFRFDRRLSRVNDTEMLRVNAEGSAALANWLGTRAADPQRMRRRVRAAQAMLPLTWNQGRPSCEGEFVQAGAIRAARRLESLITGLSERRCPRAIAAGRRHLSCRVANSRA